MICFHKSQLRNRENIPFQLFLWERRGGQVSKLFINDMIIPTNTKSDHFSMTNVDFSSLSSICGLESRCRFRTFRKTPF